MKVLVVEDDRQIRRMLARKFKKTDWKIEFAENGKSGLERALEIKPDLVLMDMHMPIMDGHTAVSEMREYGYNGTIVAFTASAMRSDIDSAIESGCDYFIAKPVDKDFINQIEEILNCK